MAAVSQALVDFANQLRPQPGPGVEVIATPRYQITLQPDFPLPGPNSVSWVRCSPDEVEQLVEEVHASVAPHHVRLMWVIDPGTLPPDLARRLAARGIHPDPREAEVAVMVLPSKSFFENPDIDGLEFRDALADPADFRAADMAAAEGFGAPPMGEDPDLIAQLERRRLNFRAAGNRHQLLAVLDGEPAGSGGLTLYPPIGATLNGGSVRPAFRGCGVYRALVAARLEIARKAALQGVTVWGGSMSAPILTRLGFVKVGWRRFLLDSATG